MRLKHSNINPESASKDEILLEIDRLKNKQIQYANMDLALKKFIVSCYGVIGNPNFFMYDPKIAETITLQGQDMIKFIANAINKYFKEKWYFDNKIHKALGIEVENEIQNDVVIYIATDSVFISFEEIIKTTNWKGKAIDFIIQFYELRLKKYLENVFNIYAQKFGVENLQFMKMESISNSGIWLGKNKYILDVIWEQGGINHETLTNIISKGTELIQKDMPSFIREKLWQTVKFILKEGKKLDSNKLSMLARSFKNEFKLQDIENISFNIKINNYENYIIEDQIKIEVTENCPVHIKASAIYNYKLSQNKALKSKYNLIKTGDIIKYYYTKSASKENNVFAFHVGNFPIEFAPSFDYDLMFIKTFINPINKILKIINIPSLSNNLIVVDRWF